MKTWKLALITAMSFFTLATVITLSSCEKDPCVDLNCKNGGSCSNGYCQCPVGFEGAECEITAASKFVGVYAGSTRCGLNPNENDTVSIVLLSEPNQVKLKMGTGNTSLLGFTGTAQTPETDFVTHVDAYVDIHAYVTVDGDLLYVYLETIDKQLNTRQICRFSGHRISSN